MADVNNISVKLAKYEGDTRVNLIENNEYGYVSLVKATKSVLEKINIENRTTSQITAQERKDSRLWNPIALREAIINAFVHNDYTKEIAPKFEVFNDRIEITSVGSLPDGLSQSEFFEGYSIPRNKELMRVFKDLDLVEQLGSGVPRILEYYGKDCFHFSDNFLRMTFPSAEAVNSTPQATPHVTPQVTPQVEELIKVLEGEQNRLELQEKLGLSDRKHFRETYLNPAIDAGLIEMTIPDKPTSSKQKYRLTESGKQMNKRFLHEGK